MESLLTQDNHDLIQAEPSILSPMEMEACEFAHSSKNLYRVYISRQYSELVEASTAAEAVQKAKSPPLRVVRESKDLYYALPGALVCVREDGTRIFSDVTERKTPRELFLKVEMSDTKTALAFDALRVGDLARAETHKQPEPQSELPTEMHTHALQAEETEEAFVGAMPQPQQSLEVVTAPSSAANPIQEQTAQPFAEVSDNEGELSPEQVAELLKQS